MDQVELYLNEISAAMCKMSPKTYSLMSKIGYYDTNRFP